MERRADSLVKLDPPVLAEEFRERHTHAAARSQVQTEDILNSILPPREFKDDEGRVWVHPVSSEPATRLSVITLQEQLDKELRRRQAREVGICPVRQELYAQTFDELIRQDTIICAERGVLLARVRDELRMTVAAFQTLYESAVAYGVRKALLAEQGKAGLESRVKELEEENEQLRQELAEVRARLDAAERGEAERRAVEERRHGEEIIFLKRQVAQLKGQLENVLSV
eukprot:gnl/Chilomastix_cuspidata/1190.p3 GENE.gnl/Chilomastix_cuspidata/1190~~gnl/Chilomastix_cuspidata/1190.p3  ORF type:complete len:228 (-),score=128.51 gnl/Chilomastix_cuspidata/1190:1216-1899(-)